jgi:hypothetical protein
MRAPVPEQAAQERAGHGTSEEEESMSSLTQLTRAQRTARAVWTSGNLAPYAPAPPLGTRPASLWGTEEHVSQLLGDGIDELSCERRSILFEGVAPDAFVDLMRSSYGPVLRVFERLGDDRAPSDELDAALRRFALNYNQGEPGRPSLESEYQLTLARRR